MCWLGMVCITLIAPSNADEQYSDYVPSYKQLMEDEISLRDAIKYAIAFQPRIKIANNSLEQAITLKRAADNHWHPVFDFQYTDRVASDLDDRTSDTSEKVKSYAFLIKQDLNFIRTRLQKNIADNSLEHADVAKQEQMQTIALGIAILYLEALRNKDLKEISERRQDILDEYFGILKTRFEIGDASELQLKRIGVAIKRSRSEEAFLERRLNDSLSILASSIGIRALDVNSLISFDSEVEPTDRSGELFERAMVNNLALKLALIDIDTSIERKKQSRWSLYPDVSLVMSRSYDEYREGSDGRNSLAEVKLSLNVWDGMSRRASAVSAGLDVVNASEIAADIRLDIRVNYDKFTGNRETAHKEYMFAKEAEKEALELIDLQRINFERGEGTTTNEIVSAVEEWSDSISRAINAYYDILIQDFQLMNLTADLCQEYC